MYLKREYQLTQLRKKNKKLKIGLCHGVFDILHHGHLEHFIEAKKKVDILVVSVTSKPFVNKGPRQPLYSDKERINLLNSIKYIDYVFLNKKKDSINVIKSLKPNFYFKGKDYLNSDSHGNLQIEIGHLKKNNGTINFTQTNLLSSTKIFNKNYEWTSAQKKSLREISKINSKDIQEVFDKLSQRTINIIGEPIIDRYVNCDILGTTTKDPAISVLSKNDISIGGGVLAAAKMAATFVKKVNLFTYGDPKYLKNLIKPFNNINIINFSKNKVVQCKTRYTNSNRGEKLIQITNLNKNVFSNNEIKKCISNLKKIKNQNLIICDFGVGLFENKILKFINKSKLKKYLNVQTNSVNYGFNLFNKYKKAYYLSLDTREWSLGLNKSNLNTDLIKKKTKAFNFVSMTRGKGGSIFFTKNRFYESPVFINSVKDTTGSGDAFFIITSLLIAELTKNMLVPFIGNLYAGMHGQNLGNKKIITKQELIQNIVSITKI
jgi:cytidyltransferase-like protein